MPSQINLPRASNQWSIEDVEKYNKLPYYLASLEAKLFPMWQCWSKLYGSIPWQPNMGSIMRGVVAEKSPVLRQMFFPKNITEVPNKDVHETAERVEEARVKRHNYESSLFTFLPSFQDFRKNQINFATKNLTEKVSMSDDFFVRSMIFHRSPYVFISGKPSEANGAFAGAEVVSAPVGDGSEDGSTAKTTAWLQEAASKVGNNLGNLGYKVIKKAISVMREDFQVPYFEGMANSPTPNETIKGKYVMIGSNEAFEYLSFDEHILTYKDLNLNLLTAEFSGSIGSHLVYKSERFPLRMLADGTFPSPQTVVTDANAYNKGEAIPNPDYVNAPFEWAFICGAEAYKTITVGAPPKEFSSGKVDPVRFSKLEWNGTVRLVDPGLVKLANGEVAFNKYGEFLQLISDCVHGCVPVNRRYVMPILYRRVRVPTN